MSSRVFEQDPHAPRTEFALIVGWAISMPMAFLLAFLCLKPEEVAALELWSQVARGRVPVCAKISIKKLLTPGVLIRNTP